MGAPKQKRVPRTEKTKRNRLRAKIAFWCFFFVFVPFLVIYAKHQINTHKADLQKAEKSIIKHKKVAENDATLVLNKR